MVIVEICIGSACYVKGSNQVVTILQKMIDEHNWQEQVSVKGAFCMQMCTQGLGIKINGQALHGIGLHNVEVELERAINEALL